MRMTNSMNKARQRFEARGSFSLNLQGYLRRRSASWQKCPEGRRKPSTKTRVAELPASKRTDLLGATIDDPAAVSRRRGRTPGSTGLAAGGEQGMPINAFSREPEKSGYNRSSR